MLAKWKQTCIFRISLIKPFFIDMGLQMLILRSLNAHEKGHRTATLLECVDAKVILAPCLRIQLTSRLPFRQFFQHPGVKRGAHVCGESRAAVSPERDAADLGPWLPRTAQ